MGAKYMENKVRPESRMFPETRLTIRFSRFSASELPVYIGPTDLFLRTQY